MTDYNDKAVLLEILKHLDGLRSIDVVNTGTVLEDFTQSVIDELESNHDESI